MTPRTRAQALLAAARVAGGAALLASCTGGAPKSPAPAMVDPMATVAPSTESLDACRTKTAAAFPDGQKAADVAADVLACCQSIAQDWDGKGLEGMNAWKERTGCCTALEWRGSAACTPWGPPTPPELPAEVA